MTRLLLFQVLLVLAGVGAVAGGWLLRKHDRLVSRTVRAFIGLYAAVNLGFLVFLWFNHVGFPLHLDLMEGLILQHLQQLTQGQPVYPVPSPDFVPLAYNPLFYVVSVPFAWLFGTSLPTMRFVAILGHAGIAIMLYLIVLDRTRSHWWSFVTVGLVAAAYRVMDAYLDTAHADSCFLFTALLGTYMLGRSRTRTGRILAVLVLVLSFWFKQHGAWFAIGGVLYLTWQEGVRRSLPYWAVAALAGPAVYLLVGPALFGSHFHYFTWTVPRGWSTVELATAERLATFVALSYPVLALLAALFFVPDAVRRQRELGVYLFQFLAAMATGVMGALDAGSSNNVFIPMGTFLVLCGLLAVERLHRTAAWFRRGNVFALVLLATFALLAYRPATVIQSSTARESYRDLISMLKGLEATVYAPYLARLPEDYTFFPTAHWAPLEDMIRGPGKELRNHPVTRRLLDAVIHPRGKAFILTNTPLEEMEWSEFLLRHYVLEQDFGRRFEGLRTLPGRWDHGYPRLLYRYRGAERGSAER
ncbi:MAG: hypothetical protein JXQ29_07445 [Planctomycetes bacterium]|nr:hypothetical protein [Planctomycetota bacterium]